MGRLVEFTSSEQVNRRRRGGWPETAKMRCFTVYPADFASLAIECFGAGKNGLKAEVVGLTDRIIFVLMAVGAPDAQPEHGLAKRDNLVVASNVFQFFRKSIEGIGPLT